MIAKELRYRSSMCNAFECIEFKIIAHMFNWYKHVKVANCLNEKTAYTT